MQRTTRKLEVWLNIIETKIKIAFWSFVYFFCIYNGKGECPSIRLHGEIEIKYDPDPIYLDITDHAKTNENVDHGIN